MLILANVNINTIYTPTLTLFDQSVTADTDILTTDISIGNTTQTAYEFHMTNGMSVTFEGAFASAGNFYFVVKRVSDGMVKTVKTLNGANLSADCGGTFNITLTSGYTLNIRYSATTTINYATITVHGGKMP